MRKSINIFKIYRAKYTTYCKVFGLNFFLFANHFYTVNESSGDNAYNYQGIAGYVFDNSQALISAYNAPIQGTHIFESYDNIEIGNYILVDN